MSRRLSITRLSIVLATSALAFVFAACTSDPTATDGSPSPNGVGAPAIGNDDNNAGSGAIHGQSDGGGTGSDANGVVTDANSGGTGEGGSDAPSDAPGAGCNVVSVEGAAIPQVVVHQTPPAMTGGSVPSGRYVLASSKMYTPAFDDGQVLNTVGRITLEIAGSTLNAHWDDAPDVSRYTGTITFGGGGGASAVSSAKTCQSTTSYYGTVSGAYWGSVAGTTYTWDGANLVFSIPPGLGDANARLVKTYVKK